MKRARGRGGGGKAGSVGMATAAKAGGTLRRRGEDTRLLLRLGGRVGRRQLDNLEKHLL